MNGSSKNIIPVIICVSHLLNCKYMTFFEAPLIIRITLSTLKWTKQMKQKIYKYIHLWVNDNSIFLLNKQQTYKQYQAPILIKRPSMDSTKLSK